MYAVCLRWIAYEKGIGAGRVELDQLRIQLSLGETYLSFFTRNSLVNTLSKPLIESESIALALRSAVTRGPSIIFLLLSRAI